jgi:hypothetical protein
MRDHINEHDMTKKMMDIIRGGYKKNLITEQDTDGMDIRPDSDPQKDAITVKQPNKEPISKDASGNETEEYSLYNKYDGELESNVGQSVNIESFIIYIKNGYAVLTGKIILDSKDNSFITFDMTSNGNIEIDANNISGGDNADIVQKKLFGYFDKWKIDVNNWIKQYKANKQTK